MRRFRYNDSLEPTFDEFLETKDRLTRMDKVFIFIFGIGLILALAATMFAKRHLRKLIIDPIKSLRSRMKRVAPRRDLTDRRFLEITSTFRTVLERFPCPIYFVNQEGEVFYSNPAAGPIPANGLLPPEVAEWWEDQNGAQDVNSVVDPDEAIPVQMADTIRYFLINHFPLQLNGLSGETQNQKDRQGAAILLQDVSLTRLSNELKNNLLETVSHELKTPITSARLAFYLLSDEEIGTLNEQQASLVACGKQDLDRLLSTIENLLDLSRIRNRNQPAELKPLNLVSVVRQSVFKHSEMASTRDIRIELECRRESCLVMADETRISVVMNNLLTNAIHHSDETSTIRVIVAARGEYCRVEVIDTSKGMPKHLEEKVFDKFSRASEIVDSGGGIGLHIARDIIEEHGGNIDCRCVPNEGCTFSFDLPCLEKSLQEN